MFETLTFFASSLLELSNSVERRNLSFILILFLKHLKFALSPSIQNFSWTLSLSTLVYKRMAVRKLLRDRERQVGISLTRTTFWESGRKPVNDTDIIFILIISIIMNDMGSTGWKTRNWLIWDNHLVKLTSLMMFSWVMMMTMSTMKRVVRQRIHVLFV